MARRQISPERKGLYYFGNILIVIGFLLCFGTIIGAMFNFPFGAGPVPHDFNSTPWRYAHRPVNPENWIFIRFISGMILAVVGSFLSAIGKKGMAGSGIILDPEEARRDVEPWSRMTGGMVKDALDEAGVELDNLGKSDELPFDERLRRLQKLREDGVINEEEYEATKKKILESA